MAQFSRNGVLTIDLLDGDGFKKKAMFGKPRNFAVFLTVANMKKESSVAIGQKPTWNQKFEFRVDDNSNDRILLEVYERKAGKGDSMKGKLILNIEKLRQAGKGRTENWYPLGETPTGIPMRLHIVLNFQGDEIHVPPPVLAPPPMPMPAPSLPVYHPPTPSIPPPPPPPPPQQQYRYSEDQAAAKIQALYRGHKTRQTGVRPGGIPPPPPPPPPRAPYYAQQQQMKQEHSYDNEYMDEEPRNRRDYNDPYGQQQQQGSSVYTYQPEAYHKGDQPQPGGFKGIIMKMCQCLSPEY